MKSIIYFILSVCVILFIAVLCIFNIMGEQAVLAWGTIGKILQGVRDYGALVIVLAYAVVNFFGSPLKTVFFVLLVLAVILFFVTKFLPDFFQNLFGVKDTSGMISSWLNF